MMMMEAAACGTWPPNLRLWSTLMYTQIIRMLTRQQSKHLCSYTRVDRHKHSLKSLCTSSICYT